ncbi:hypothetical protein AB0C29_12890 [Actinoplanes sp. NPDC048791]|uniref:hypothetical protein n=1 Tax=Actinoplanes sp. NPDC048791 TaxID=3154623 RepID=UPI0033D72E6B
MTASITVQAHRRGVLAAPEGAGTFLNRIVGAAAQRRTTVWFSTSTTMPVPSEPVIAVAL